MGIFRAFVCLAQPLYFLRKNVKKALRRFFFALFLWKILAQKDPKIISPTDFEGNKFLLAFNYWAPLGDQ